MSSNVDFVLRSMLAEYQRRIAAGVPKREALKFDGSFPGLWDVASELKAENLAQVNILGEVFMSEVTFLRLEAEEHARLAAAQQEREDHARKERQRRFENKVSVAAILVSLVTFILGLVAEHFAGIVGFISELLSRWIK